MMAVEFLQTAGHPLEQLFKVAWVRVIRKRNRCQPFFFRALNHLGWTHSPIAEERMRMEIDHGPLTHLETRQISGAHLNFRQRLNNIIHLRLIGEERLVPKHQRAPARGFRDGTSRAPQVDCPAIVL